MSIYEPGEHAWLATWHPHKAVEEPCPVCFGKCEVTLILGDESRVVLPCDYCGKGQLHPTGYVTENRPVAAAKRILIDSVAITKTTVGELREYRYRDHYIARSEDLFDTEAEALARAQEKADAEQAERDRRADHIKADSKKSFSWNAGYHLRCAKKDRESAERHERLAVLCKERARDSEVTT